MKKYLRAAVLLGLGTLFAQAATAQTTDSAALQQRAIRKDVQEKQKALARDLRNDTPAPVAAPVAPLDLPVDETDSPGATR